MGQKHSNFRDTQPSDGSKSAGGDGAKAKEAHKREAAIPSDPPRLANPSCLFNNASKAVLEQRLITHLLQRVVKGEQAQAEALLDKNPRLLLPNTGTTTDHIGRQIKGLSPWQVALCNGDAEMLVMMQPKFDAIHLPTRGPDGKTTVITGEQIRLKQTQQIFPHGYEAHAAKQAAAESVFNFDKIVAVINAARNTWLYSDINLKGAILPATHASVEKTNEGAARPLTTALNAFRRAFTEQSLNENIYNPQHLLRAFEIYRDQYHRWNKDQHEVFWTQVIGFTQRFMPTCYAQAFAQGLNCLVNRQPPQPLSRSLDFGWGAGKIFSDDGNDFHFDGLGFEFAAADAQRLACDPNRGQGLRPVVPLLKTLIANKNQLLSSFCPDPHNQSSQHPGGPK